MANIYYDVRVDIQKNEAIDSGLRFTQGDSNVIFLRIAVTNGNAKFDASNTTASICFVKADGTYVVGTLAASGDVWIYQFLGNELQKPGKVLCDVKFTYASGRISSSKFSFLVESDTTVDGATVSSTYVAPMQEALNEMLNYKQQGKTMADSAEASAERAENAAESAEAIVGIGIATTSKAGIVKPDGETITITADGTISSQGGGGASSWSDLTDKPFESLGDDFTTDSSSNLVLSSAINQKLSKLDSDGKIDYSDVKNTPTIPTITDTYSATSSDGMSGKAVSSALETVTVDMGIVADEWESGTYSKGDIVQNNGKIYESIQDTVTSEPTTTDDYWKEYNSLAAIVEKISIKKVDITVTTNTNGNANIASLLPENASPIIAIGRGSNCLIYKSNSTNTLWIHVFLNDGSPLAEGTAYVTVLYL